MEVAIKSGNEHVIEWFMDYIEEENNACGFETASKACFKVYCKIGNGIHRGAIKDWTNYDAFRSYLEDIVDDKINATNGSGSDAGRGWTYGHPTGKGKFETLNEVSDNWVRDLCGGLI